VRAVTLKPHGEGPDPVSESHDHCHLDGIRRGPGRHDAAHPRLNSRGEHRPELPDAPARLVGGPRRDLARGP
jgi:hypothetical protein